MKQGFTLVELSIVLVIIGLLIGGILVAQSLVESAKVQAQVRQLLSYEIAVNNFDDKFNSLPGDSAFFSGDGDGLIERRPARIQCATGTYAGEMKSFFTDLSSVGFSKTFDGSDDLDKGYPALAINDGIGMLATSQRPGFGVFQNKVFLCLRVINPSAMPDMNAADQGGEFFPPAQALAIDRKIDDGLPLTGVFDAVTSGTGCHSTTAYLPNNEDVSCRPTFEINIYR